MEGEREWGQTWVKKNYLGPRARWVLKTSRGGVLGGRKKSEGRMGVFLELEKKPQSTKWRGSGDANLYIVTKAAIGTGKGEKVVGLGGVHKDESGG